MTASRLTLAAETGALVLPSEGMILAVRPRAGTDLSALPSDRVQVVQGFRPDHDAFAAMGFVTATEVPDAPGTAAAAVVFLPRARAEARALIAAAAQAVVAGGPIAIDGLKTDGVDACLKELRGQVALGEALAKAHGKIAVFANPGPAAFAGWQAEAGRLPEGFVTHPAAFSAGGVDPGSAALAQVLPASLPRRVADLGGGWGFLTAAVLARQGVDEVHLVEAEHAALAAARVNLSGDPRVRFHWADATREVPGAPVDAVVMNPPFHAGRSADPALGRAFIAAAARALTPSGTLWMVANRHLPYETALRAHFRDTEELPGGTGAYKLIRASVPLRATAAARSRDEARPRTVVRARR